jgi:hypothetical protein
MTGWRLIPATHSEAEASADDGDFRQPAHQTAPRRTQRDRRTPPSAAGACSAWTPVARESHRVTPLSLEGDRAGGLAHIWPGPVERRPEGKALSSAARALSWATGAEHPQRDSNPCRHLESSVRRRALYLRQPLPRSDRGTHRGWPS